MPEGPEVYISSKFLEKYIKNNNFTKITSNTKTKVDLPKTLKILEFTSFGKVIILISNDYIIHIHLGITGWFVKKKPRIFKYILHFENKKIYLQDRRRFSSIKIFTKGQHIEQLKKYGVDILSHNFTFEYFYRTFKKYKKYVCALLMDQKIFAGLGNYIKNEALYLSKISPYRKTHTLTDNELYLLHKKIKFVAFSNLVDWHNEYNIKISNKLKLLLPKKLLVPYEFFIFDKEKDKNNYDIIFDKKHCGRRTYYVKEIQK